MIELSLQQARGLLLHAQGLVAERPASVGAEEVVGAIRRMGVLQIDTIHVVARSPYFVLWSRLGAYEQRLLDGLLKDRRLFEQWSHAACFIPMEQYPLYRRFMIERRRRAPIWAWLGNHSESSQAILEHVRQNGPVRSADFERTDGKKGGWWEWKHEKVALEHLFMAGELMILERERFQRVYALREHVVPEWTDDQAPSLEAVLETMVEESVRCLGVGTVGWIADYFRLLKGEVTAPLRSLVEKGLLCEVRIEGVPGKAYVGADSLGVLDRPQRTVLLSPFDPVVWHRERSSQLFGFDYTIECYLPEAKRQYGYFVLPILHRDSLVGRLDAKAHRKEGVFEVRALYLEPAAVVDDGLIEGLGGTLRDCARWHKTPTVRVAKSDPKGLARKVQAVANRRR